jgi:lysylphosphatidylglycerol synthetase-like protein (DUF2156 family)
LAAAALGLIAAPAHAEMSVGTFVVKADALKKKGMMAMMSSDVGLLKKEMGAATLAYRNDIKAARATGRPPHSCPPAKGSMNSDDLIAHFRTLPANTGIKAGFYALMKKKYPCP